MIPHSTSFEEALGKKYLAAMFDIDGTLTEMGESEIPKPLRQKLCAVSEQVPVAFCSGRRFEGIVDILDTILAEVPAQKREALRRQWFFFLENGSIGVAYNDQTGAYERFYDFQWPEEKIPVQTIHAMVEKSMAVLPPADVRRNQCNVGVYPHKGPNFSRDTMAVITAQIAAHLRNTLNSVPGFDAFHVIDSGIAVHVMSRFPDKDFGIAEFAAYLRKRRQLSLDEQAREIVVVGDQPGPGFNDERFLQGEWGTPFTVGNEVEGQPFPIPVMKAGERLYGPSGTLHLLEILFTCSLRPQTLC